MREGSIKTLERRKIFSMTCTTRRVKLKKKSITNNPKMAKKVKMKLDKIQPLLIQRLHYFK